MNIDLRDITKWKASIELSRSKSITIRYLIFHYLKSGELLPIYANDADDVRIVYENLVIIRDNRGKIFQDPIVINVHDCGTAYRFLLSVLAVTDGNWFLTGSERLLSRPIDNLVDALRGARASINKSRKGLYIIGKKLAATKITIDCTKSSQFASSLLLISEVIGLKELEILPKEPASAGYITMTKKIMADINRKKKINLSEIERDWSAAAFWYALVALCDGAVCELPGLQRASLQSDSKIIDIFNCLRIITTETSNGIVITHNSDTTGDKIHKFSLDLSENPDLTPILAVMAILLKLKLHLTGLQNLNFKESKRLEILGKVLSPFAKITIIDNKSLDISEIKECRNQNLHFKSYHDHRLVMAFTLFATQNKVMIENYEVVSKSYPNFFQDVTKIGC